METGVHISTQLVSSGLPLITSEPVLFTNVSTRAPTDDATSLSALAKMQIILYILMAFAGAIGNSLTIAVLFKAKFRKRKSSILLLNLAVCDAIIATLCIPLDVAYFINGRWIYGKVLCYIISPFQTSMPIVSSWSFMYMMIERNSLFTKHVRGQMRRKSVRLLAMSTWIVPIALVIPYGIQLQFSDDKGVAKCYEEWENKVGRKLYTVVLSVSEFLIPMLIVICLVIRICINLGKQSRNLKENSLGLNQERRKSRLRQNKNMTVMFIVMVTLYAVLKLPNNIFWQWNEFGSSADEEKKHLIWTFVSLAAYSTSMVNPIVLAAMSKEFRQEFIYILRCQVFSCIQKLCIVFRSTSNGVVETTIPESSSGLLGNPYKSVGVEMNDRALMTPCDSNFSRSNGLIKKNTKSQLTDTESTLLKEGITIQTLGTHPETN